MKKVSFASLFIIGVFIITFPIFIYHQIDYHFLNPVNQAKMPDRFSELRSKIQTDMNNLIKGLPKPVNEWSYYKPSVNLISEFKSFPYNDEYLSIILGNIPKDRNIQMLQKTGDDVVLSYCDYNVHIMIKKNTSNNQEFIDVYMRFEDRGVCMY